MPTARGEAHRLRSGTYSAANITSTYAVTAFTVQSDQVRSVPPWAAPVGDSSPEYARVVRYADGSQRADGYLNVTWTFSYFTFGMLSYIYSTFLASSVYSASVSLMTYNQVNSAVYLNATLLRPVVGADMEPHGGGFKNVKLRFIYGSIAS